ncbi:MAG: hypothetical protein ABJH04_07120 [Cyclobacteriaceae bacterium]
MNKYMFLRLTAVCSLLGAITTALLIFLPNTTAVDDPTHALLSQDSLYMAKKWILFLHPQVNFIASLGVAYIFIRKFPLQILLGSLFLLIWCYTEMAQQAFVIDALNQIWRAEYLGADHNEKGTYHILFKVAGGLSDSYYFLLLYGFGLGTLLFALAFIQTSGLARWIGYVLVFIGVLSLLAFASYYLGLTALVDLVGWMYKWIYAWLQPAVRIAISVWLFNQIIQQKDMMSNAKVGTTVLS